MRHPPEVLIQVIARDTVVFRELSVCPQPVWRMKKKRKEKEKEKEKKRKKKEEKKDESNECGGGGEVYD